jgi:hypothetical protein
VQINSMGNSSDGSGTSRRTRRYRGRGLLGKLGVVALVPNPLRPRSYMKYNHEKPTYILWTRSISVVHEICKLNLPVINY